ncbi:MAG: sulfotransferase domain-containing protein, partial [Anaerolineae bacterium]|nr:sulfotransferase domain-containing protein [Anaerolineae bacterium]
SDAPPIFGNSKPKSGSHLLLQILNGMNKIIPYTYVSAQPIRTIKVQGGRRDKESILSDLQRTPPGVIGWGYVEAEAKNVQFLCQPNRVNYFVYRDPRDLLVSQVYYATEMHENHGMHKFYKSLPDFGERLKIAITGIDQEGLKMVSVKQRYASVFEWLKQPYVMCIRFEDLINNRYVTLNVMLDEIEKTSYEIPTQREKALSILVDAIQPKKSHTFRSGITGSWSEHFTDEHKGLFIDIAGDLLVRLGYEKNNNW